MELGIRGKVAVVTGASAGIGEAVALALAGEGVRLALVARRADPLRAVAARALAAGARQAQAFVADLTEAQTVERLFVDLRNTFGDVDILVANSGGPKAGAYLDLRPADWEMAYGGTFRSMIRLVDEVLPAMQRRKWGRIVALTSVSVKQPIPNLVLSNAFRTALTAALKTLSSEVAPLGITVNTIATGHVLTDRLRELYGGDENALREASRTTIPIGRPASPDEYAPMAAFLCGEPARYVTGQTIAVDGGLVRSLL